MHIILGVLGTVVTILVLLNRLSESGYDLGWLNPFSWHRRRQYRLNHDLNPALKLTSPMESTALVLTTIAKVDGDMSKVQKDTLLRVFTETFHLESNRANELLRASVHLFGNGDQVLAKPQRILDRSLEHFSGEQIESLVQLMADIANAEGEPSAAQREIIKKVKAGLPRQDSGQWR